jgi:hypothetical protein
MNLIKVTDSNMLVAGATLLVKANCCDQPHRFKLKHYRSERMPTNNADGSPSGKREPGWEIEPTVHGYNRISAPNLVMGVRRGRVQAVVK